MSTSAAGSAKAGTGKDAAPAAALDVKDVKHAPASKTASGFFFLQLGSDAAAAQKSVPFKDRADTASIEYELSEQAQQPVANITHTIVPVA